VDCADPGQVKVVLPIFLLPLYLSLSSAVVGGEKKIKRKITRNGSDFDTALWELLKILRL
jgi:hypothetical protein